MNPTHPSAQASVAAADEHYRAGAAALSRQQRDVALNHFEKAAALNPDHCQAHAALAELLASIGRPAEATQHARRAMELAPRDRSLALGMAGVLAAAGQSQAAGEIVRALISSAPASLGLAILFGHLAKDAELDRALAMSTGLLSANPAPPPLEQCALHFSAARVLDRMARYDEAFSHAEIANRLRGVRYDRGVVERLVDTFITYFTPATVARLPRATHVSEVPVFIVGMPRSGTSLAEQIIASHPAVHGAGESDRVYRLWESAVRRHSSPGAPLLNCLERITASDAGAMADQYLDHLRGLAPAAQRVTDKTPANFMHLGLIQLLFPHARVVYCRRDPLDTCLSCYFTDFAAGGNFSFDLAACAHFHMQNDRLMAHWKSVLNIPILDVNYEQVVEHLEPQARRMIEFIGLPWNQQCLQFHQTQRIVSTASQQQVRRPIYQSSVGRWRHYQRHLAPLIDALPRMVRNQRQLLATDGAQIHTDKREESGH